MKALSFWASKHIQSARIILTIAYLMLAFCSILFGLYWAYTGASFPEYWLLFFILISLTIGIIKYPDRKRIKKEIRYGNKYFSSWKLYDLLLVLPMFLIATSIGHELPTKDASAYPVYQLVGQFTDLDPGLKVLNMEKKSNGLKTKVFNRLNKLNKRIKNWAFSIFEKIEKTVSANWIWFVIVLLIVLILFAQYLLVGLACSLSCNGNVAGAFIAFFGGSGVLFFILFRMSRSLFKIKAKKDKTPEDNKTLNKKSWRVVGILGLLEGILVLILSLSSI